MRGVVAAEIDRQALLLRFGKQLDVPEFVVFAEEHTVGLARRLHDGLVKQGYRMFTPLGNRSSIITFYVSKPIEAFRDAFRAASIDVTLRGGQVRVAPAFFNNADETERCLEVTKRLV